MSHYSGNRPMDILSLNMKSVNFSPIYRRHINLRPTKFTLTKRGLLPSLNVGTRMYVDIADL